MKTNRRIFLKAASIAGTGVSEEELKALREKYTPPIVKIAGDMAKKVGGHGGMDFLMQWRLIDCLRNGLPLDMDCYGAAAWSSIVPLSEWCVANNSVPVKIPDFTRGGYKTNAPLDIEMARGGGNTGVKKITGCLLVGLLMVLSAYADDLKIGAASVKITPPLGTPMAGYYSERGAQEIHDDLFAKALVIEKNGTRIAIVGCDLIGIPEIVVAKVRELAEKSTGMDAAHVMIGATHTHTGPVLPADPSWLTSSPAYLKRRLVDPKSQSGQILYGYITKLPGLIADSITQANAALKPARLSFGLGREDSISFNRRFFMTDGTVGWNPGLKNPKIIKPAGPIDPDVAVLYAETLDSRPISTFVNFALHLDEVGGLGISADLPYTLSTILREVKGSDMATIFSQGCSGNINHIDVNGDAPHGGHFRAEKNGTILAGEVIKTYARLSALDVNSVKVKSEIVPLPLAKITKEELAWAREIEAKYGKPGAAPFLDFVKAFKVLRVAESKSESLQPEIQVFAIGDSCAIVSFPYEMFTELGQYIKSRSPYPYTIITEITNGYDGYIPDRKAYAEGNYEPISTKAAPGSGEILVENALRMLNELKKNQ